MKFTPKLTALFISIGAIVAIIMYTIAYFQVAKILEGEIKAHMENRVIFTMDGLDHFLHERSSDIKMIAGDPVISSGNATVEQITERLIYFRNAYKCYVSLSFFNLERIRIADTAGINIGQQHQMTRYWEDVLAGQVSAASDVRIAEVFQMCIIYFASPVKNKEGKAIGVVVARIPTSRLFEMVKVSMGSQEEEEEIDIVNKDGLLIYSNHNRESILKENLPEWESIKIDQQEKIFGSAKHQHPGEKETTLYVFCRERGYLDFKGNDWVIISHIPLRVIFGPVNNLLKRLIIMFLVMLPGLAFVIYLFSKTVTRPLTRLSFAAVEIGKGKLDTVIEVKSKDEIGSLANTFNEMAADLKKTTTSIDDLNKEITERKRIEEVLRDSEAGFRAIFDNANDGILLADEETKKFYTGNNTACQMLGYSLEEIKNLGVPDIHPKEDLPYVIEQFEKQVRREIAVAKDLPVKRKNGSVFYADVNTSLIILAGRTYLLGLFRDITEHKRAEEEREKLIHELQDALGKIKTLSGLLPICASCKKIRDDKGYWNQIEAYIGDHSEAEFTHSICPECMKKLYPDF
jgi:PAS domain S-box-containing protein